MTSLKQSLSPENQLFQWFICGRHCPKQMIYIVVLNPPQMKILIPTFQTWKLRRREIKQLGLDHPVCE